MQYIYLGERAGRQPHLVGGDVNSELFGVETVQDGLVRSLAVLVGLLRGLHVILVRIIVAIGGLEEVAAPELREDALDKVYQYTAIPDRDARTVP